MKPILPDSIHNVLNILTHRSTSHMYHAKYRIDPVRECTILYVPCKVPYRPSQLRSESVQSYMCHAKYRTDLLN